MEGDGMMEDIRGVSFVGDADQERGPFNPQGIRNPVYIFIENSHEGV